MDSEELQKDHATAWEKAEAYGCDMSLIDLNMKLSPTERCIHHDQAMNQAMALRNAALKQIDGLSEAIKKTA